ncbi:MAG: tyrosine-protein kinase Etk/Wzc [Paraburkholderia sp.]|nr:tyrosine-protein kinase Etk/Wzc [Paraburkholderia sp.]
MTLLKHLPAITSPESKAVDFAEFLDILVENRAAISIVTALFVIVGALYAWLTPPIYEAAIMMQVEEDRDPGIIKGMLDDVPSLMDMKSPAEAAMQILGSRLVLSRSVDALRLYIAAGPRRFPLIGGWIARQSGGLSRPGILGIGGYAWGGEAIDVGAFDVPPHSENRCYTLQVLKGGRYALRGDGIEGEAIGRVGVVERFAARSGSISLWVKRIDAQDGIVFELTRHSFQQTVTGLRKALSIVEKGRQSGVVEATMQSDDPELLSETLNEIGRQYLRQNIEAKAEQAKKSLEFLVAQQPEMKRQLEEAEDRYNAYRNTHSIIDLSEEGKVILQRSAEAESKLLELKQKRDELAMRYMPQHPSLIAIDGQIAEAQRAAGDLTGRIKQIPLSEQSALRLERDMRVDTNLYVSLLNNIEQLKLLKASRIGNVRLIDRADVPQLPVKPRKLMVIGLASLAGVFAGVGLAFSRDAFLRGITDASALESQSGLPVYAAVPYSKQQESLTRKMKAAVHGEDLLLATRHQNDPAIESLRSLRTGLQFAMLEARNNIVLLTGPSPGIGKSFVSANLSAVLAASGKRVLLIDGDLRAGHLNQYFGEPDAVGLSDAIAGGVDYAIAIRQRVRPNLDFLPRGTAPLNPAELLLSKRWIELVHAVSARYDIVLIDSAPVIPVSDAGIIAPVAGTVFLLARFAQTRFGEISESVKRLAQGGSGVNGLILDGVKPRRYGYGYGGKYVDYRYVAYRRETEENHSISR